MVVMEKASSFCEWFVVTDSESFDVGLCGGVSTTMVNVDVDSELGLVLKRTEASVLDVLVSRLAISRSNLIDKANPDARHDVGTWERRRIWILARCEAWQRRKNRGRIWIRWNEVSGRVVVVLGYKEEEGRKAWGWLQYLGESDLVQSRELIWFRNGVEPMQAGGCKKKRATPETLMESSVLDEVEMGGLCGGLDLVSWVLGGVVVDVGWVQVIKSKGTPSYMDGGCSILVGVGVAFPDPIGVDLECSLWSWSQLQRV